MWNGVSMLTYKRTHTLFLTHTFSLSLSLSLSHTHTQTNKHTHTHVMPCVFFVHSASNALLISIDTGARPSHTDEGGLCSEIAVLCNEQTFDENRKIDIAGDCPHCEPRFEPTDSTGPAGTSAIFHILEVSGDQAQEQAEISIISTSSPDASDSMMGWEIGREASNGGEGGGDRGVGAAVQGAKLPPLALSRRGLQYV